MTKVKVTSSSEGLGVVLPADVVERFGLRAGDELTVMEADGTVTLSKNECPADRKRDARKRVLRVHARTFERLASR